MYKKIFERKIIFITLSICILLTFTCINKKTIIAKKGVIDLRNWDFDKDGVAKLDGEWELFDNKLLDSFYTSLCFFYFIRKIFLLYCICIFCLILSLRILIFGGEFMYISNSKL